MKKLLSLAKQVGATFALVVIGTLLAMGGATVLGAYAGLLWHQFKFGWNIVA